MKKMMFNDRYGLTEAVLQGMKTVTRRLINKFPNDSTNEEYLKYCLSLKKPPYEVGEIVAVAQRYVAISDNISKIPSVKRAEFYGAIMRKCYQNKSYPLDYEEIAGWTNKMFVKADLMPHQIRITGVRAERLQDILEVDAANEGIRAIRSADDGRMAWGFADDKLHSYLFDTPREAFASLIDKVSGKGTWESNPYVWRIEFEYINQINKYYEKEL